MVEQLSLKIHLDGGDIMQLEWVYDWIDWPDDACQTDLLGFISCAYTDCSTWDPNIFITWVGNEGESQMISDSYRFEFYKSYDISSYYQSALEP
jgi:hypothetical protein